MWPNIIYSWAGPFQLLGLPLRNHDMRKCFWGLARTLRGHKNSSVFTIKVTAAAAKYIPNAHWWIEKSRSILYVWIFILVLLYRYFLLLEIQITKFFFFLNFFRHFSDSGMYYFIS